MAEDLVRTIESHTKLFDAVALVMIKETSGPIVSFVKKQAKKQALTQQGDTPRKLGMTNDTSLEIINDKIPDLISLIKKQTGKKLICIGTEPQEAEAKIQQLKSLKLLLFTRRLGEGATSRSLRKERLKQAGAKALLSRISKGRIVKTTKPTLLVRREDRRDDAS